jgi:hypothetical protein
MTRGFAKGWRWARIYVHAGLIRARHTSREDKPIKRISQRLASGLCLRGCQYTERKAWISGSGPARARGRPRLSSSHFGEPKP